LEQSNIIAAEPFTPDPFSTFHTPGVNLLQPTGLPFESNSSKLPFLSRLPPANAHEHAASPKTNIFGFIFIPPSFIYLIITRIAGVVKRTVPSAETFTVCLEVALPLTNKVQPVRLSTPVQFTGLKEATLQFPTVLGMLTSDIVPD
jgi:hypothetical protein